MLEDQIGEVEKSILFEKRLEGELLEGGRGRKKGEREGGVGRETGDHIGEVGVFYLKRDWGNVLIGNALQEE